MHRMRIRAKGVKIYAFLKNTHIKRVFFRIVAASFGIIRKAAAVFICKRR